MTEFPKDKDMYFYDINHLMSDPSLGAGARPMLLHFTIAPRNPTGFPAFCDISLPMFARFSGEVELTPEELEAPPSKENAHTVRDLAIDVVREVTSSPIMTTISNHLLEDLVSRTALFGDQTDWFEVLGHPDAPEGINCFAITARLYILGVEEVVKADLYYIPTGRHGFRSSALGEFGLTSYKWGLHAV